MSIVVNKTRLPVTEWQTVSGSVVSIANARRRDAKSLYVNLEPIQDLHGYDAPWVGGAGKNLYNKANGAVGYFVNPSNKWASSTNAFSVVVPCFPSTTYTVSKVAGTRFSVAYAHELPTAGLLCYGKIQDNTATSITITTDADAQYLIAYVWYKTQDEANISLADMLASVQVELGSSPSSYEPYENLCPISGHSAVTLNHAGTSQSDNPTSITIQLGQTVYGGTVELVSGVGTLTMANIASYNGETIGEPWLSSMDKYVAGATPTTGAQVVYTLATPITFQLTPTQLSMLERNNTLWADEGDISVTYARIHS